MNQPVLRTTTIRLTLKEAADALGHKDWSKVNDYLDADILDDVYHGGYSLADAKNFPEPSGMKGISAIFPDVLIRAMEDAERDATAHAIGEARRNSLIDAFEKIVVTGEYQAPNGEMITLPKGQSPGVEYVKLDVPKDEVEIRLKNPEHLINDIVNGVGYYSVPFDPYSPAHDDEIKRQFIVNAEDYFSVYGDSKPGGELDSRFVPYIDDNYYAERVKEDVESMTPNAAGEAAMAAFEDGDVERIEDAITLASRLTKIPYRDIEAAISKGFHGTPQGIDFGKLRDLIEKGNRIKITKEGLERFQQYLAGQPTDRLITDIGIMEDPELKDRVYVYSKSAILRDLVKPVKGNPKKKDRVPARARENARLGLALRRIWGRGGTLVGVARARDLSSGKNLSKHTIKRMAAFSRHRKSSSPAREHRDGGPTAGYIAWLLWGGDEGINWAMKEAKKRDS